MTFAPARRAIAATYYPHDVRGVRPAMTKVWSPLFDVTKENNERADVSDRGTKIFSGMGRGDTFDAAVSWATNKFNVKEWTMCPTDRSTMIPADVSEEAKRVAEVAKQLLERPVSDPLPEGLVEFEVPNSTYKLLRLKNSDPTCAPTQAQRHAIAARLLELAGKLPRYIPGHTVPPTTTKSAPAAPRSGDSDQAGASRKELKMETETTSNTMPGTDDITRMHAKNLKETKKADAAKVKAAKAKAASAARSQAKAKAAIKASKKAPAPVAKKKTASPLATGAKAAQAASKKAASTDRAEFAGYPLTAKVKVISAESEFNQGSIRDTVFRKLCKATTVTEARKASPDPWHLKNAVKTHRIKVIT